MESLQLNGNCIKSIPSKLFNGLLSLKEIYLCNNQIGYLDSNLFEGLLNLEDLYLGGNKLKGNKLTLKIEKNVKFVSFKSKFENNIDSLIIPVWYLFVTACTILH